jgi:hypothetical protein
MVELERLEDELSQDITQITNKWNTAARMIEEIEIKTGKDGCNVDDVSILWIPIVS